jgi:hypothetical protein
MAGHRVVIHSAGLTVCERFCIIEDDAMKRLTWVFLRKALFLDRKKFRSIDLHCFEQGFR